MAINTEILKAIPLIDQKISTLQELRESLAREFGLTNGNVPSRHAPDQTPLFDGEQRKTRKQQVADLLRESGPLPRAEILKRTALPKGTIAYCLNDDSLFRRSRNGNWRLVSAANAGTEEEAET